MKKVTRFFTAACLVGAFFFISCGSDITDLTDSMEELKDAAEEIEENVEEAKDEMEENIDEAKEEMEETVDSVATEVETTEEETE